MHFRARQFLVGTSIVTGVVLLTTGALLWVFSDQRQLQKPVMDGQPINYWLERMSLGEGQNQICQRLVSIGPPVTAPLLAALNDKPSERKIQLKGKLINLLGGRWPGVERWLLLEGTDQRWMAAYTLAEMPPDPKIRSALIGTLAQASDINEDSNIGFCAVKGLRIRYTNDAVAVVKALEGALRVPHDNIQASAAGALASFGTNAYQSIPDIIALARAPNDYLAGRAAAALGEFGPVASNALSVVGSLLTNGNPTVRREAAVARWKIAPELGFPEDILRWNMKNASLQERLLTAKELWKLDHTRREETIEVLLAVIQSPQCDSMNGKPYYGAQWLAAQTLGSMGADAASALPVLSAVATGHADQWLRHKATEEWERIERAVSEFRRAKENAKN